MAKLVKFTGEDRKSIENYLKLNDTKKQAAKDEKAAKENLIPLFANYGIGEITSDCTAAYYGYVQEKGENVPVVMKNTVKSGAIDYENLILALQAQIIELGGTPVDTESFRKPSTTSITIERMSKTMRKELGI